MGEALPRRRRRSKPVEEPPFPISKFGLVVCALSPVKPALWLAQRIPCTERHANYLISGRSKPSARAIIVVMDEID